MYSKYINNRYTIDKFLILVYFYFYIKVIYKVYKVSIIKVSLKILPNIFIIAKTKSLKLIIQF